MRIMFLFFIVLQSLVSIAQKTYSINNTLWKFTAPSGYKTRIDNFSSTRQNGDSILRKNNQSIHIVEEQILFSVAKNDSVDINAIFASYKRNSNIEKFTLKGYAEKLVDFIKINYEKLKSDATTITREISIDGVKFIVIENKIYHKAGNYTYWNEIFIAEISGQELNITVVYDNDSDKKTIEDAISQSKFVSN